MPDHDLGYDVIRPRSDMQRVRDAKRDKALREQSLVPPAPTVESTVVGPRKAVKRTVYIPKVTR